ncbi:PGF-CTERM sorting domain-containing protein [Salinigranum sp.]|uniref:PGF-CTERM sorting domain-containing protein n=1 Tax=Salinigranum sp. TaxID=1966351 RepID=UPI003564506D
MNVTVSSESTASPSTTPTEAPTTTPTEFPGFGVVLTVVAILAVAPLAIRRRGG